MDKKIISGGEDPDDYTLYYKREGTVREKVVSEDVYSRMEIGSQLQTVYLQGRKKPILEYDQEM